MTVPLLTSVHRHDLRSQGQRVRFFPAVPSGPPDLDNRSIAHCLLALGHWSDEVEVWLWESRVSNLALGSANIIAAYGTFARQLQMIGALFFGSRQQHMSSILHGIVNRPPDAGEPVQLCGLESDNAGRHGGGHTAGAVGDMGAQRLCDRPSGRLTDLACEM